MTSHEFRLRLNRSVTAEDAEALYAAGCSDAAIESGPLGALLDFDREAPSLAEALLSAIRGVDKVPGLRAVGVACDNIVSLADIAERTGVSREAARLWSTGQRGPGGFPSPVVVSRGGERGWDWLAVLTWVHEYRTPQQVDIAWPSPRIRVLCMADQVLAARHALRSEPDESVREEFERLLQDA